MGVSAAKDAVCIAWITVHMHDSTDGGSWTGDIGYNCDQKWYPQSESAGNLPDGGGKYIPHCTWLDEDHTDDVASAALKFKTTAYAENVTDTLKNDRACQFTLWGPDNGPISGMCSHENVSTYGNEANDSPYSKTQQTCAEASPRLDGGSPGRLQHYSALD